MDIRNPKKRFDDQLHRALRGEAVDTSGLLQEEIEILHMVSAIKKAEPQGEPGENFSQNLRKRLLNTHELMQNPARAHVTTEAGNLLTAGTEAQLARPRRWAWAVAPIAAIAVLAAYVSFAAASPGFYEKYVPQSVKKVLEDTKVIQTGNLQVTSDPSGALVLLNGQEQGTTPAEIGNVRVGTHLVTVKLAGYADEQRSVEIKADEATKVEVALRPAGSDVQPTPTPTPSDVVHQAAQVVLLNQTADSTTLEIGSTAGGTAASAFKIQPAAEQVAATDSGVIFFSQKQASGTTIYRLSPQGDLQAVVTSATGLAEKFAVTPDGAAVSYVTAVSGGYEIHLAKVGGADQIIYTSPEAAWLPIGFQDGAVVVAQTAMDRRTVKQIITIKPAQVQPLDWSLPAGTNILLDSQTAYHDGKVLLQNGDKIIAVKPGTDQPSDVFTGEVTAAAWAGAKPVIVSGAKIELVDLASGQAQEIYTAPASAAIKKVVSDSDGKTIAVWLSATKIGTITVADQKTQTITSPRAITDCLEVVGPATLSASDKVIDTTAPATTQSITPVGELKLGAAQSEALATFGSNIVRVSNGDKSLEVISLADSAEPTVIGSLPKSSFSGDMMVATTSRYGVITGGQLQFVDLQNTSAPKVIGTEAIPAVGVGTGADKAYVVADGDLLVYDLATSKPKKVGEVSLDITQALGLIVKSNRLFIAAGDEGLVVVDVTNSAAPAVLQHARDNFVRALAPAGKYVYVFTGAPGSEGSAEAWDATKPAKVKTISPSFALGQVYGDGTYLYAAAPKLAVYEPLADGTVKAVNEAEASDLSAGDTQIAAPGGNMVTLSGGKLQVYQVQK